MGDYDQNMCAGLIRAWFLGAPCTVAHQAPLPMEFSRQEYWSGAPFPTQGESCQRRDLTGISVSPALAVIFFMHHLGSPWPKNVCLSHSVMFNSLQPHGLSMKFSRQRYWNGLPFSSPGDLPDSGIEPWSPALQAYSLLSELPGKPPKWAWVNQFILHEIPLVWGSSPSSLIPQGTRPRVSGPVSSSINKKVFQRY